MYGQVQRSTVILSVLKRLDDAYIKELLKDSRDLNHIHNDIITLRRFLAVSVFNTMTTKFVANSCYSGTHDTTSPSY